jgi:hypothetical protein
MSDTEKGNWSPQLDRIILPNGNYLGIVTSFRPRLKMMKKLAYICAAFLLAGCATGTNGVVELGPNSYMLGGLGKFTDFSSSVVKARFFQDASTFCANKGLTMVPLNSTGKDSGIGTYASAEVQFQCVPSSKP